VTASYDKSAAFVVLPPIDGELLANRTLRRWLQHSDLQKVDPPRERLSAILTLLARSSPEEGLAAMRMWGQTGDRPTVWIAGADPIYLEPRRDRLSLHALGPSELSGGELQTLIDHLQSMLGDGASYGFARVGSFAYLTAAEPFATADLPALAIDACSPDHFLPAGSRAAGHRRLVSEIEMALHEHAVNLARESAGRAPANSLWLWGGGHAPEQVTEPLLPLYADDHLLHGYWLSKTAHCERWPGSIDDCFAASVAGFAAVVPRDSALSSLVTLRHALGSGRLSALTLLFENGIRADVRRSHALRIWRRSNSLLDAGPDPATGLRRGVQK
jgi:hypothetical protein